MAEKHTSGCAYQYRDSQHDSWLIGDTSALDIDLIRALEIVEDVKRVQEPYKNANRKFHPADTVITLENGVKIGGGHKQIFAGPCSVESREQICAVAERVKAAGATVLRGGAFKPRSSPYSFFKDLAERASNCCWKRKR